MCSILFACNVFTCSHVTRQFFPQHAGIGAITDCRAETILWGWWCQSNHWTLKVNISTVGVHKFFKVSISFQILGARTARCKVYTVDPQILGAAVHNLAVMATWPWGSVQPRTTGCHRFANHWVGSRLILGPGVFRYCSLHTARLCNGKPVWDMLQVRTWSCCSLPAVLLNRPI
jgi:hypothetical protein